MSGSPARRTTTNAIGRAICSHHPHQSNSRRNPQSARGHSPIQRRRQEHHHYARLPLSPGRWALGSSPTTRGFQGSVEAVLAGRLPTGGARFKTTKKTPAALGDWRENSMKPVTANGGDGRALSGRRLKLHPSQRVPGRRHPSDPHRRRRSRYSPATTEARCRQIPAACVRRR
jgi:hypothetical protein